ncbi:hypothetical protein [Noviherbaspirillum galbum]|uniref:Uncharacterized protein n=1 Tax=Noviherbaspirillum galbum TaxID=2709383 RepID=A0A6B3SF84_9BURK|nr:hypothetical protein [Noviherbaspirillum galbum]NEX59481.1 hypothetical protein [Noviherbaspirillum galbum]
MGSDFRAVSPPAQPPGGSFARGDAGFFSASLANADYRRTQWRALSRNDTMVWNALPKKTLLGIPYELGPKIGNAGPYAIPEWIDWNGERYWFNGVTVAPVDRIAINGSTITVPPNLRFSCADDDRSAP